MIDEESEEDLGGRLLDRLHRQRTVVEVPEPPVNKGLTNSGVTIVITACVVLMALPILFLMSCGTLLMSVAGAPVSASAPPPPLMTPVTTKTYKRLGKDVEVTVTVDNSASTIAWDAITIKLRSGSGPATKGVSLGVIPAGKKKSAKILMKNVPRTRVDVTELINYRSSSGTGSQAITEVQTIP